MGVAVAHDSTISSWPTFDCEKAKSNLGLLICSGEETARADWDYKIAHWARYFSLDEDDRAAFWKDQDKWTKSLDKKCQLSGPPFSRKQKSCVIDAYEKRAAQYRSKLRGGALAESKLTPEQLSQIQQALITMGFFRGEADGQFGPLTRAAIREYREANGLPPSDFLSVAQTQALLERRKPREWERTATTSAILHSGNAGKYLVVDASDLAVQSNKYIGKPIEVRGVGCFHADEGDYRCAAGEGAIIYAAAVEPPSAQRDIERNCGQIRNFALPQCTKTIRFTPIRAEDTKTTHYQDLRKISAEWIEVVRYAPSR